MTELSEEVQEKIFSDHHNWENGTREIPEMTVFYIELVSRPPCTALMDENGFKFWSSREKAQRYIDLVLVNVLLPGQYVQIKETTTGKVRALGTKQFSLDYYAYDFE